MWFPKSPPNDTTCKTCIEAGANVLVAGSAVYKAADIPAKIKELRG
mgnify:CR=1 FL=1